MAKAKLQAKKEPEFQEEELQDLTVKIELTESEKDNKELAKGRRTEYVVPKLELEHVHVELEKVNIDSATFKKESTPYVQIFDPRSWNQFRNQALKLGFNHVRVLHAPAKTNLEIIDPTKAETKEAKTK